MAGTTCMPLNCGCGGKTCMVVGCTDDLGCGSNEYCTTAGVCAVRPCQAPADCPTDFTCTSNACIRKSCTTDVECSAYCLGQRCFSARGTCTLNPV
jgi:hypothetical protein